MKKTSAMILLIALIIVASIAAIQPALSKSEKTFATATLRFPTVTAPQREINTNGDIRHVFGVEKTFFVTLTLDKAFNGQTTFEGTEVVFLDFATNFKTGDTFYHSTSFVWTFPDGNFEGTLQARQRVDPSSGLTVYEESLLLQGSGIFKGCTLNLSQTNNQPYTGTLMVPASAV